MKNKIDTKKKVPVDHWKHIESKFKSTYEWPCQSFQLHSIRKLSEESDLIWIEQPSSH